MKAFFLKLRKILLSDILYLSLLFISLSYAFIYIKNYEPNTKYDEIYQTLNLTIKTYKIDGDKLSLEFKENLIGTYYFTSEIEKELFSKTYSLNDQIEVKGDIITPEKNTVPNLFNYKKYLYHKGINNIITISNIRKIKDNKNILYKIKNKLYNHIESIENNSYLYAFILGSSSYIESNAYNNYKINGVTHLFALSGLHVSLFSSFLLLLFTKLKLNENTSFILTSIFLILFSFIASFTPSILRSVIFFILNGINKIYYTYIKPKNILYLTFILMIIYNPNYLFNNGFILSFSITYSIILFNEKYKIENKILNILGISIISFLGSLPIIINMNHEINILCFFNNIIFIPFVTYLVFPLSLLTVIFPLLSNILLILTNIMEFFSNISSNILNLTITIGNITYIEIIIYYVIYMSILKGQKRLLSALLLIILYFIIKPLFINETYINCLDVGQGDSIFMKINKYNVLIDTGPSSSQYNNEKWKQRRKTYSLATNTIIPYLKSNGINHLDYLIITHGDQDHIGEAINLVNSFKVENVIFNCGPYNNLEQELIKILNKKKNINYYSCIKELNIDKYKLQFLNTGYYNNENDNSNVIFFDYNNYKFLFMGDAGKDKEKDLLEKYNLSEIDFLKVGHHGSNTSSSELFINSINPKYSLISVGKNNRYGHPKDEVLETLKNSKIYRTDLDGSIEIKLNKSGYKIRTCPP